MVYGFSILQLRIPDLAQILQPLLPLCNPQLCVSTEGYGPESLESEGQQPETRLQRIFSMRIVEPTPGGTKLMSDHSAYALI
jgi:hypothetical protein